MELVCNGQSGPNSAYHRTYTASDLRREEGAAVQPPCLTRTLQGTIWSVCGTVSRQTLAPRLPPLASDHCRGVLPHGQEAS
jgi:hypothetical protein